MDQVINIFFNGIAGVFLGISVLYIAIRINAAICTSVLKKSE